MAGEQENCCEESRVPTRLVKVTVKMTPNSKTKIKQTIHKLFEQPFARTGLDQFGRKQTYTCERSASLAD